MYPKKRRSSSFNLKAQNERQHFKNRLRERYGLDINRAEYLQTVERIRAGEARLLCEISLKLSLWEVEIKGVRVPVLYDSKRKELVTVFTADMNVGGCVSVGGLLAADRPMTREEYAARYFNRSTAP